MTSHVAQFFVQDEEWERTLADLKRALVSGGRLVFDTRDPQDLGWEKWNPEDSFRWITMSDGRVVEAWTEVTDIRDGAVSFAIHYEFPYEKALLSTATLRFRPEDHVRAFLKHAGFVVEQIYGGWNRENVGAGDGELLVIARA